MAHISDITIFVFLCLTISRSIHVAANGIISFFFMADFDSFISCLFLSPRTCVKSIQVPAGHGEHRRLPIRCPPDRSSPTPCSSSSPRPGRRLVPRTLPHPVPFLLLRHQTCNLSPCRSPLIVPSSEPLSLPQPLTTSSAFTVPVISYLPASGLTHCQSIPNSFVRMNILTLKYDYVHSPGTPGNLLLFSPPRSLA